MQATNKMRGGRGTTSESGKCARRPVKHLRSPCPVANLLDLAGDKWSLLVVRDLLRGHTTFSELVDSPEKIPTNILADRLKRLEKARVLLRVPYQKRPVRYSYRLTEKGRDLRDVLDALVRWSKKHVAGVRTFTELK
jgi:DNA-binding HxlR family transcriptional regulator